jgi:hypothetical protein
MTKTQSNDVPENLWRNEVFHDRGDYQGQARADHHHAPGDPSLLEAEYIFADCSRRNRFFLQFGRRSYITTSLTTPVLSRDLGALVFVSRDILPRQRRRTGSFREIRILLLR